MENTEKEKSWEISKENWKIWLICSNFGIERWQRDKYPKNICQFTKMFILSIIAIPVAWISHIMNMCWRTKGIHAGYGTIILLFGMGISSIFMIVPTQHGDKLPLLNILQHHTMLEKLLIIYATAPLSLIAVAIVLIIIGACVFIPAHYRDKWIERKRERKYQNGMKTGWNDVKQKQSRWILIYQDSWIKAFFKGLKNKYCVAITYTEDEAEKAKEKA